MKLPQIGKSLWLALWFEFVSREMRRRQVWNSAFLGLVKVCIFIERNGNAMRTKNLTAEREGYAYFRICFLMHPHKVYASPWPEKMNKVGEKRYAGTHLSGYTEVRELV